MGYKTVKILDVACSSEYYGVVRFLLRYSVPGADGISVLRWWSVMIKFWPL